MWPEDNRCPVLGIVLQQGRGAPQDSSPSLDRLNPEWGYERGNVVVMSNRANTGKSHLTAGEHERIAAWMRSKGLT